MKRRRNRRVALAGAFLAMFAQIVPFGKAIAGPTTGMPPDVMLMMEISALKSEMNVLGKNVREVRDLNKECADALVAFRQDLKTARQELAELCASHKELHTRALLVVQRIESVNRQLECVSKDFEQIACEMRQLNCELKSLSCLLCSLGDDIQAGKMKAFIGGLIVGLGISFAISGGGGCAGLVKSPTIW